MSGQPPANANSTCSTRRMSHPRLDLGNTPRASRLDDNSTVVTLDNPPTAYAAEPSKSYGLGQPVHLPTVPIQEDITEAHSHKNYADSVAESGNPQITDFENDLDNYVVPAGDESKVTAVDVEIRRREKPSMATITRRAALFAGVSITALGLTACISSPPMDEKEVNDAVSQVEGVTSVNITVERSGTADWSLRGEVGLPDDPTEARTVYENCLRAIAAMPAESNLGVSVSGVSVSGDLDAGSVGAPDDTRRLKEHFS